MYAIVDIETTGGFAKRNNITEIAIVIHDGLKEIERFETLVNPGSPIPIHISALTGITDEMVSNAPAFNEIAEKIAAFLSDKIFVAHNVNFDYSFVKKELAESGYKMPNKRLCTVRYARKISPGLRSYSLRNLCRSFDIINSAPHRAMGDAAATTILLEKLLKRDIKKEINQIIKTANYPTKISEYHLKTLPEKPGVYYFKNSAGKILYIGKAKNIKNRVISHFNGDNTLKVKQDFYRHIATIDHVITGSELLALLLEDSEIRQHWPKHNKAQKTNPFIFSIEPYIDRAGMFRLGIQKLKQSSTSIAHYYSLITARNKLMEIVTTYRINGKYCGVPFLGNSISDNQHQENFEKLKTDYQEKKETYIILDQGRSQNEEGFAFVHENIFAGIGFIPSEMVIQSIAELEPYLIPCKSSGRSMRYIEKYLEKNTEKKVINL